MACHAFAPCRCSRTSSVRLDHIPRDDKVHVRGPPFLRLPLAATRQDLYPLAYRRTHPRMSMPTSVWIPMSWCCADDGARTALFSSLVREVADASAPGSLAASCLRLSRKISFLEEIRHSAARSGDAKEPPPPEAVSSSSPLPYAPRLARMIS
ncbi:hypothetical protein BHE74_00006142 [Ensete ventricosum]|nr:hypothetical protein BHE74_00006142 [Ensete ventricosum]